MEANYFRLTKATNELVAALFALRLQEGQAPHIQNINDAAFEEFFSTLRQSTQVRPADPAELRKLIGESYSCLQLVRGFLAAAADAQEGASVIRFEVTGANGVSVPVVMPPAATIAMEQDAKRLLRELTALRK